MAATDHHHPATLGRTGYSPAATKPPGGRSGCRKTTHLSHCEGLFVRVSEVQSGVVVGQDVIETRFDNKVSRRVRTGINPDALLP